MVWYFPKVVKVTFTCLPGLAVEPRFYFATGAFPVIIPQHQQLTPTTLHLKQHDHHYTFSAHTQISQAKMAHFFSQSPQPPQPPPYGSSPSSSAAQSLQFYPSAYSGAPTQGYGPSSSGGGYGPSSNAYPAGSMAFGGGPAAAGFGGSVTGRMGEQGGLRTGWLAAFGTEGYDGEPPLLEELGVNFGHIKVKVLYF